MAFLWTLTGPQIHMEMLRQNSQNVGGQRSRIQSWRCLHNPCAFAPHTEPHTWSEALVSHISTKWLRKQHELLLVWGVERTQERAWEAAQGRAGGKLALLTGLGQAARALGGGMGSWPELVGRESLWAGPPHPGGSWMLSGWW